MTAPILAEALREAEFFVQMNSEPAYRTGQQLLAKIRAALAAHDAASAPGMAEALREAEFFVQMNSEPTYRTGQQLLAKIRAALAAHDAASVRSLPLPPLVGSLLKLPKHVQECVIEYGKACAARPQPASGQPQAKKEVACTCSTDAGSICLKHNSINI